VKKRFLALAPLVLLSGCLSLGQTQPKENSAHNRYYTLDAQALRLCQGDSRTQCFELNRIAGARFMFKPIEDKYGQSVQRPNYPRSLAMMLINPPDQSYVSERVDIDGQIYRLPANDHTHLAWRTIDNIFKTIYSK